MDFILGSVLERFSIGFFEGREKVFIEKELVVDFVEVRKILRYLVI